MTTIPARWSAADLRRFLSAGRFDRYVQVAGSDVAGEQLYEWNQLASGAWHETLGSFEIVLRNALDAQLISYHQRIRKGNGDWYADPKMPWGTGTRLAQSIRKARSRATLNKTIPEVHGKVIAELNFGFWRYTLAGTYQSTLWAQAYRHAFPHLRPRSRTAVYDPIVELHELRNRVAHHEPIHGVDHTARLNDLLQVLAWIDPAAAAWVEDTTRIPAVLGSRP
ncbi:hypothetical protein [Nocardia farcinica]|uniref:hypothetical protein n=1 Tax=Nocardia farcinica TaxID=37329 RepID=UPI0024545B01|nr:hypothetical protein [Nocardia farcinica]